MLGKIGAALGTVVIAVLVLILLVTMMSPAEDRPAAARETSNTSLTILAYVVGGVKHAIPTAVRAYRATDSQPRQRPVRRDAQPNRPGFQRNPA